jgi:hypothetical protein
LYCRGIIEMHSHHIRPFKLPFSSSSWIGMDDVLVKYQGEFIAIASIWLKSFTFKSGFSLTTSQIKLNRKLASMRVVGLITATTSFSYCVIMSHSRLNLHDRHRLYAALQFAFQRFSVLVPLHISTIR